MIYWGSKDPLFFMEIKTYTSPGCFYCDQLKELFKRAELESEYITIDSPEKTEKFRAEFPAVRGFPFVIIDGEHIGGLVETAKLLLEKGLVSSKKK